MSTKKRDTCLSAAASGTDPSPSQPVVAGTGISLRQGFAVPDVENRVHVTALCITARDRYPEITTSVRNTSTTFVKGFSQTYTVVPNSNVAWWHRRLVVATKEILGTTPGIRDLMAIQDTEGVTQFSYRDYGNASQTVRPEYLDTKHQILELLFKGTRNVDWVDPFRATVDRQRITVLSDRRMNISSGNDTSRPVVRKFYDSINKSLMYGDEEIGTLIKSDKWSTKHKPGIGNIYVLDFWFCPAPAETTDSISLHSQSTYYWHEK